MILFVVSRATCGMMHMCEVLVQFARLRLGSAWLHVACACLCQA